VSTNTYKQYDALGEILASSQTTDTVTFPFAYQYNRAGGLTQLTYPSGRLVNYAFDGVGREKSLTGTVNNMATGFISNIQYAAHGEISSLQLANGLWETTNFSPRLEVTDKWLGSNQNTSDKWMLHNNFLANSNVQNQTLATGSLNVTQNYSYDTVNRLTAASESTGGGGAQNWSRTHNYDAFGNMWISSATGQMPGMNAPTAQSSLNAATNQLAGPPGMYDAAGNLQMVMGTTYSYDAENRVTQTQATVNGSPMVNSYSYDGEGRRVVRTPDTGIGTVWYVYDAMGNLAAEYDSKTDSPNLVTQFVTTDHLGSTRAVADGSGNLIDCHDYLPFGEEISQTTGNRPGCYASGTSDAIAQKFTGDERDSETQEDFFKARYFSGPEGRFRSIDPIGIPDDVGDPQGWNKYTYTRNNPLLFTDTSGEDWWDDVKGIASAIWNSTRNAAVGAVVGVRALHNPRRHREMVVSTVVYLGNAVTDYGAKGVGGVANDVLAQGERGALEVLTEAVFGAGLDLAPFASGIGLPATAPAPTVDTYLAQGFSTAQATYLAQPYEGMGHHFLPRRWQLPSPLADSPLARQSGSGMTRGEFYEFHYKVDTRFFGARFPDAVGGHWSGSALGLQKYGVFGRLWYGSPTALKTVVGGAAAAGARLAYQWEGR
jgi:RHS repeat-associated protein